MPSFSEEVETRKQEMLRILESIEVENLRQEGVTIKIGSKLFKFNGLEELSEEDTEEKIRNEFREKLNSQQQRIREKINAKINQLLVMHQRKSSELQRKEAELERKYSQSAKMPDISWTHLAQGLSVVKGNENDELVWSYRGVYRPKTLDHKPIPERLVNRMTKNILIVVRTKGKTVSSVNTFQQSSVGSLEHFPHYHQTTGGDCWGRWNHPTRWENPNNIIQICKHAEAILENVNSGSVAKRSPNGLPRMETLTKHVNENRNGLVVQDNNNDDEDVWSV
jgi:hypothetical protein